MITTHELEPSLFQALASGGGGIPAVAALRRAQVSKHLLLIRRLLERWPDGTAERNGIIELLDRARRLEPERFDEVLAAPMVGAWIAIAVRAAERREASPQDFSYLRALAVVACAATGVPAAMTVPVVNGAVVVPGHGVALVDADRAVARLSAERSRLTVWAGRARVEVDEAETSAWQPIRQLIGDAEGLHIRLGLDDVDPYRYGHHAPPSPRLAESEVQRWRALFAEAWQLLARHQPGRAAELAAGLRALVPLAHEDPRSALSATIKHAFGVFGLTRPPSAAEFAVTLVHEFQHSKLSAMLDLMPFSDPADRRRYFAPWRVDARPLSGLLQGVYAFVGVADTWRALRGTDIADVAEARFAEARLQVDRGLTAVEDSGALTPAGQALAARLRQATNDLLAEDLPPSVVVAAERALAQTHERWLARNGVPEAASNQQTVSTLADR